jgi:hypothetical protein
MFRTKGARTITIKLFLFIRGPTYVTQTDVWVSRGNTLSLFKRRGEKGIGSGNWWGLTVRAVNGEW